MPIGDTPAIQIIIDEALGAGIDHIVVVSSRSKPALEAYFVGRQSMATRTVPDLARGEVDTVRLNQLFDELAFGGMLRQRCLQV